MNIELTNPTLFRTEAFVNGEWIGADNGARLPVTNPATGALITDVAKTGAAETRRAIAAAETAMLSWRQQPAKQRAQVMRRWFDLIMANQEDLARIMTLEQGKTLAESRGEVAYGASYIEWFAEQAKRIDGDVIPAPSGDKRIICIKQPVGVCAAITPWNFPNAMITRKAAPALAAGCTIVIKPASETPLSALALAELAHQAGIPPGVLNVLAGSSSDIGAELTSNPTVRKLSFTGSTPIGKMLEAQCVPTLKKTSMELGGNAPFIVFDDADIDSAVQGALISKYRNSGQTCVCSNRLLVQAGIAEEFTAKLVAATESRKLGKVL
jgi:succinate-semialdehyde dehydrogenase/glutarate-semialdehyde dehydrogenase